MKISEVSQKDKKELNRMLIEKKEELHNLRFDLVSGKTKNIAEIRRIKKDIARIFTAIKQK
jgi:large subunit ribosomal protein L29